MHWASLNFFKIRSVGEDNISRGNSNNNNNNNNNNNG